MRWLKYLLPLLFLPSLVFATQGGRWTTGAFNSRLQVGGPTPAPVVSFLDGAIEFGGIPTASVAALPNGSITWDSTLSYPVYNLSGSELKIASLSRAETLAAKVLTGGRILDYLDYTSILTPASPSSSRLRVFETNDVLKTVNSSGTVSTIKTVPSTVTSLSPIADVGEIAASPIPPSSSTFTAFASATRVTNNQTATITIASPAVVTVGSLTTGMNYVGMPVVFATTGALPTGLTAGTVYYVSNVLTATTFRVSATLGGADVNTSGSQSGTQTAKMAYYSVIITTGGRPVKLQLVPDTTYTAPNSGIELTTTSASSAIFTGGSVDIVRTGTSSSSSIPSINLAQPSVSNYHTEAAPGGFVWTDVVAAGTYQYVLWAILDNANETATFYGMQLIAQEL